MNCSNVSHCSCTHKCQELCKDSSEAWWGNIFKKLIDIRYLLSLHVYIINSSIAIANSGLGRESNCYVSCSMNDRFIQLRHFCNGKVGSIIQNKFSSFKVIATSNCMSWISFAKVPLQDYLWCSSSAVCNFLKPCYCTCFLNKFYRFTSSTYLVPNLGISLVFRGQRIKEPPGWIQTNNLRSL